MSEHYVPNTAAWERYKNNGGQGEFKARTVSTEQDNLVQLTGMPGYWWKRAELTASTPVIEVPKTVVIGPFCVIEVHDDKLSSHICAGDLQIEYEDEEDEDCGGEDCTECSGDGCTTSKGPLSAVDLLKHLLDSYDNCATTFAEENELDASDVDVMYRDLLTLVKNIRHRA